MSVEMTEGVAEQVSVDLEELTRIVLDRAGISEYLLSPRRSRRREENHLRAPCPDVTFSMAPEPTQSAPKRY